LFWITLISKAIMLDDAPDGVSLIEGPADTPDIPNWFTPE
jgi:hypothetical protein